MRAAIHRPQLPRSNGAVRDHSELQAARGWHRNAHALVRPGRRCTEPRSRRCSPYVHSPVWQVRSYAAARRPLAQRSGRVARARRRSDERVSASRVRGLGAAAAPARRAPRTGVAGAGRRRLSAPGIAARHDLTIRDVGRFEMAC
jgi:hypothetical protein